MTFGPTVVGCAPPKTNLVIDIPTELRISEVCCVGLSVQGMLAIRNPNPSWVQLRLTVVSVVVDDRNLDLRTALPFVFNEQLVIKPNSKESVPVSLDLTKDITID